MNFQIPSIEVSPEVSASLRRLGWMGALLVTAMVVIAAVERRSMAESKDLIIKVEPLGDDHFLIKEKEVKRLVQQAFGTDLVGEVLDRIDVEKVELTLEQEPFILDANVYFDAANQVNVDVQQRQPLLRIMDNNGLNYYLDENGVKMPPSKHYAARVIVATGAIPPYTPDYREKKQHILKDLFFLTNYVNGDEFLKPLVEQIHVSKGEYWLVPKVGDQKIILGSLAQLDEKIEKLKIFYKEGISREGWQRYERIDLRFDGQVVAGR